MRLGLPVLTRKPNYFQAVLIYHALVRLAVRRREPNQCRVTSCSFVLVPLEIALEYDPVHAVPSTFVTSSIGHSFP